ncbi:YdbC family protein [Desertibacillus haloalkaliphilus]|uniref:YdbC family protein n=1 Tax=Desertibacillus haloalkaliphilus TaxID=1328930 RepID=UPI001C268CD0|nr:YdbC family protein [Desertibacillus haloalkaliphilus]MBU8906184.1 YdbC family protein [Desertibacillus haloalkaliphilus]
MANIKFEIKETIGTVSEGAKGWKKELNLVSWNGREPKYDLRDWSPEHEKMGKGLTLSEEELIQLKELLNQLDL